MISVVVPIYGVEKYLNKCVESIVKQTYPHLEIILVEDGSPDGCGSLCDEWAKCDNRIKVVHKENGGLSDARNAGIPYVTGEYISFVDSDDYLELTFYEKLYAAMQETGAEIAECATRYVGENGAELKIRPSQEGMFDKLTALKLLILENGLYQTVWNKLYRREVVDGLLFAKGRYNEDEFWTYKVFDRAEKIVAFQEPLYNYLQRKSSIIGAGYNVKRLDGLDALFERMIYLEKYVELADLVRQEFALSALWHLQGVLRHFKGEMKKRTSKKIVGMLRATPKVRNKNLALNFKYKFWYKFFYCAPYTCAKLRNVLRIGR